MSKKSKKLIRYTDREFNTIKESLVNYTKRYYPDIYKDFSEASFGSLMLDTVAYVGDVLSFYLDYQVNESFIDTATEYDNVLRLGEQVGYSPSLRANSTGIISLFVMVPADPNGTGPDLDYLPIVAKGSKYVTDGGDMYELIDDVDFANPDNEIVVGTETATDGAATTWVVKAYGRVISGELKSESIAVGDFSRFLTVSLSDTNTSEVVSVTDSEGHEYFEVPFLSHDTIFRTVVNKDPTTRSRVPSILVTTSVPRRFISFVRDDKIHLKFGYGSESSLKMDNTTHPSNVVLKMHGRDYETDVGFDPSKLLQNDKFGIAPANTILTVSYRANTSNNSNTSTQSINTVASQIFIFPAGALNSGTMSFVRGSLEVTNEAPITGDIGIPTIGELKQRINDLFATQNRAVTEDDYRSLIYRMPPKLGKVKRAKILRDQDSFKRNLNLYVVSEDKDGNLLTSSPVLKNNIKTFLQHYKMINDTIDILDAKIVNIGVEFVAIVNPDQDKFEALNIAINTLKAEMFMQKYDIGQPIYITKIYDLLNNLDEIVDVVDVRIVPKITGLYSDYSLNLNEYVSADGRILYVPDDVIYEIKYPNLDIKGTIR
tara:strand:- start:305 stop:2104 length:1800 start_codon:yes stop_codon:yes gene_type:complete